MIVTRFLDPKEYYLYQSWLEQQDDNTRALYFGVASGLGMIQSLCDRIETDPDRHKFLVAENCAGWLGVLHIAEADEKTVEFGIIVRNDLRGEGIGNMLIDEALVWARNRGYQELFMHCLERNYAIKHLCQKHGLEARNMSGDSEVKMYLKPASIVSFSKEIGIKQRNIFHTFLQNTQHAYQEIYG